MNHESFIRLKNYIEGNLGIKIPDSKQIMLESRLAKRLRFLKMATYEEYCEFVFGPEGLKSEIQKLIDAVTTNETDFFRESSHYDFLTKKVLPELFPIQTSKRQGNSKPPEINIWSVAAATGQEAYTMAMVMEDYIRTHEKASYRILATDISEKALSIGETGIYTNHQAKKIPVQNKIAYCMQNKNRAEDTIRFKPYIREKILFRKLNLMDGNYHINRTYSIIFCRNVFIYFDRPTQEKVLRNIYSHLSPGGYLFMGHAENISNIQLPLKSIAAAVYRKPL